MNVKKLFKILILFFTALFISCEVYESSELVKTSNKELKKEINTVNGSIHHTCVGDCGCGIHLDWATQIVNCSCNPCSLKITMSSITGDVLTQEEQGILLDSFVGMEFLELSLQDLKEYVRKEYGFDINYFTEIKMTHFEGTYLVEYLFLDNENRTQSVAYSYRSLSDKTIRIDCTGSCDCREQFNLNNGIASCSCNDCQMTVTELKKAD